MPRRDGGLEREWRRRMRAQSRSGVTVREFCEWEGLAESAFYHWRRELERRDAERHSAVDARRPRQRSTSDSRPRFVPMLMTDGESAVVARATTVIQGPPPVIELVHPGGIVVRVPAGSDAAALETILGVLDERLAEARRC